MDQYRHLTACFTCPLKTRCTPPNPATTIDTGGEFRRRWGANKSRAMTFACNNDSRQRRLRVFSIFLASAAGKHSRIAPRNSSV